MTTKFEWVAAKTIQIGDVLLSQSGKQGTVVGLYRGHNAREESNPDMKFVLETLQHTFETYTIWGKYGVWKRVDGA